MAYNVYNSEYVPPVFWNTVHGGHAIDKKDVHTGILLTYSLSFIIFHKYLGIPAVLTITLQVYSQKYRKAKYKAAKISGTADNMLQDNGST